LVATSFNRRTLIFGHVFGVPFEAQRTDLADAGRSIGPEEEAEQLGEEVVEFPAVHRVREIRAFGAGSVVPFETAGPDFAPGRFLVFAASRTFSF
jgi:hypothetical protein